MLAILGILTFASCNYVESAVDTVKNNVKSSLTIPALIPTISLKNSDNVVKDSSSENHVTLSDFFKQKFSL